MSSHLLSSPHTVQGTPLMRQGYGMADTAPVTSVGVCKRGPWALQPTLFCSRAESPLLSTAPHSSPEPASRCASLAAEGTALSRTPHSVSCSATAILKFSVLFEEETLYFHFSLGPANSVASPALAAWNLTRRETCWGPTWGLFFWHEVAGVLTPSPGNISLSPSPPWQYFWSTVGINTYQMISKFQTLF